MDNKMEMENKIEMDNKMLGEKVEEVKRRVGRPRKYLTEEESKAAQLRQIKESYERNYDERNKHREKGKIGRKPTNITVEEIRERQRITQKRYLERKKIKAMEDKEKSNENK
jgi:hypothetical protein